MKFAGVVAALAITAPVLGAPVENAERDVGQAVNDHLHYVGDVVNNAGGAVAQTVNVLLDTVFTLLRFGQRNN
ncbi:hypothetical protein DIURU_003499 [Diutina rugosa]|uniref:Uncharacterized protein n=1 Tax=Diutina rugosa TaxID=5481 RepID=A0A642ULE9_DIURU|nr:uncharacterized protein DIURU_003499 [Diutina rugosa]KAA8901129.1 hypothetical protein DIURU_003499 [Diutina rugosa]